MNISELIKLAEDYEEAAQTLRSPISSEVLNKNPTSGVQVIEREPNPQELSDLGNFEFDEAILSPSRMAAITHLQDMYKEIPHVIHSIKNRVSKKEIDKRLVRIAKSLHDVEMLSAVGEL